MTFDQLIYFTEVYRTGSLSTASKNLFISHQALSHAISTLEDELGCTLFTRAQSGMVKTQNADDFYRIAQSFIDDCKNFSRTREISSKTCRLGFMQFTSHLVSQLYTDVRNRFPATSFAFTAIDIEKLFDDEFQNEFDILIVAVTENLSAKKLFAKDLAVSLVNDEPLTCFVWHSVNNDVKSQSKLKLCWPHARTSFSSTHDQITLARAFDGFFLNDRAINQDIEIAPTTNIFIDYLENGGFCALDIALGSSSIVFPELSEYPSLTTTKLPDKLAKVNLYVAYRENFEGIASSVVESIKQYPQSAQID